MPPAEDAPAQVRTERRVSPIAGHGLSALDRIAAGTRLPVSADDLNHSCDPNLGWSGADLVTIRDVPAGAELTLDYATRSADPHLVMMCHCGTYRCRQLIEGDDWRIPQLQQRYAGRFAPAVQRLIDAS